MSIVRRSRIITDIDWNDFAAVGSATLNIHDQMSDHVADFPNCNPTLPVYLQQVQDYSSAHQTVITTHAMGAAILRLAKRDILRTGTETQRSYVQLLCDQSPELAGTYAIHSGFKVWIPGLRTRDLLEATLLGNGAVALKAAASLLDVPGTGKARNRTYLWRHTLDGKKTYISDEATPVANTTITGLPVSTVVGFEVAVKTSVGVGQWCQTLDVLIK